MRTVPDERLGDVGRRRLYLPMLPPTVWAERARGVGQLYASLLLTVCAVSRASASALQ